MTISPAFTLGLMLATLYGALTHVIVGGDGRRLIGLILASWVGFAVGQALGQVMDIRVLTLGPIDLLTATTGSLIATITMAVLWLQRKPPES